MGQRFHFRHPQKCQSFLICSLDWTPLLILTCSCLGSSSCCCMLAKTCFCLNTIAWSALSLVVKKSCFWYLVTRGCRDGRKPLGRCLVLPVHCLQTTGSSSIPAVSRNSYPNLARVCRIFTNLQKPKKHSTQLSSIVLKMTSHLVHWKSLGY